MDKLIQDIPKKGPTFRLFTPDSLKKIKERADEQKAERAKEKEKEKETDGKKAASSDNKPKQRPNPGLAAGKQFPEKLGEFPVEFYGKPIEDIDDFYKDKYTFMVVARDGTMFRFSTTNAFFLLSPFLPLRKTAIYILTHPFFSLFITLVILVNCVIMAYNTDIPYAEQVFTGIYTVESITRMMARGFILADFTYLRDPWNWLDFSVITLAYIQIAIQQGTFAPLRTFRVLRALKTVAIVPGLKIIVGALMEAVRRLRDVVILTLFMLSIFALIGLQLYSGKLLFQCRNNKTLGWMMEETGNLELCDFDKGGRKCPHGYACIQSQNSSRNPNFGFTNFDNIGWALLCAFRLMTQDYWENLYQMILRTSGSYHMPFFIFVIFLGSFYLVNLILAIVAMSYDDCQKREMKEAEEELAAALQEEARQIAMLEEMMNRSPSLLSDISHIASPQQDGGYGLEPRRSFSIVRDRGRLGSGSQPGSPFHSRRLPGHGSGTSYGSHVSSASAAYNSVPLSPGTGLLAPPTHGGSVKSTAGTDAAAAANRPTAEELYHMLHIRGRSTQRRHVGSIRPSPGNSLSVGPPRRGTTLRRTPSPLPPSMRRRTGSQDSEASSSPPVTVSSPPPATTVAVSATSPVTPVSAKSFSPKRSISSFRRSEKTRFSWNPADWRRTSVPRPLPELVVDEEKPGDLDRSSNSGSQTARGELYPYHRSSSRAPSVTCVNMDGIQLLKDSIFRASDGQLCFEDPKIGTVEWARFKLRELVYGWEYPPAWLTFAGYVECFILDAFVDLFITLCIISNTIFMAMDHADINKNLENVLVMGNYIFTAIFATEALLKVIALGMMGYLKDRWNVFDISIVVLSLVELNLKDIKGLSILRSFRLLRVFKLAKSWPTLNLLIGIIGRTINALGNLCFVLAIIIFIFAVMGMQVFGKNYVAEYFPGRVIPRWNFTDFLHSFMIVFRVLCGEWIESTWDCLLSNGFVCVPFFLLTMIIGNLVVLNLFLALLLSSFGAESLVQGQEVSTEPNKLQEAIDRINRVLLFLKSHLLVFVRTRCSRRRLGETDVKRPRKKVAPPMMGVSSAVVKAGWSVGMVVAVPSSSDMLRDALRGTRRNYDESQFSLIMPDIKITSSEMNEKSNVIPKCQSDEIQLIKNKTVTKQPNRLSNDPVKYRSSWSSVSSACSTISSSSSSSVSTSSADPEKDSADGQPHAAGEDATSLDLCLYPTKGADVREVKVIYFQFPDDCCPKSCRWKYACWDWFVGTTVGRKWWMFRCYTSLLVDHRLFESFIIVMILGSSIALAMEDNNINNHPDLKEFLSCLDRIFTITFTLEMLLKFSAYGLKKYFTEAWCWLDFVIVVISIISLVAEGVGWNNIGAFRALRTLRALRPLKAVSRWEGMKVVVNALFQAIPAIFNVLLVCLVFWLIFSIMGVTLFAGRFSACVDADKQILNWSVVNDKAACAANNYTWMNPKINFDNVFSSYLSLFQVATFKGWVEIMKCATDIREKDEQPDKDAAPYMYLYFVFFIIFGSFFTLNLFIGVIIDNFNMQKRKAGGSLDIFMTEDQKRYYNAMKKLGSKQPQRPVPKPKLRFQLFFFKMIAGQKFEIGIMSIIVLNMICMSIEHHGQLDELSKVLDYINTTFVSVFMLECLIKILALRLYYFKQPWNVFDFIVVILSTVGLVFEKEAKQFVSPTLLRVVRVFRVGRVLRLIKAARGIRTLLFSLAVSLPALFNIGLLLFLIMFIYSIFGMSFFMNVKHTSGIDFMFNFETFPNGMLLLFQTATSAGWNGVLDALLIEPPDCNSTWTVDKPAGDCGIPRLAIAYLVSYLVISFLVIINMYIAVILENFSQATEDVQQGLTQDDFDIYYETWEKFDEQATEYIHLSRLSDFVDSLEDPLRLAAPNYFKLIHLDIPIYEGDLVHCVDILDALTKHYLGTSKDEAKELGDVKKGTGKNRYLLATSTMMRQREQMCAKLIQVAWRKHVEMKRAERASIQEHGSARLERRRNVILENIPEDGSGSSYDEEKEIFC